MSLTRLRLPFGTCKLRLLVFARHCLAGRGPRTKSRSPSGDGEGGTLGTWGRKITNEASLYWGEERVVLRLVRATRDGHLENNAGMEMK